MKERLSRLLRLTRFARAAFALAAVSALISGVLALLFPMVVGGAIDCIVRPTVDMAGLHGFVRTLALLYAVQAAFSWVLSEASNRIGFGAAEQLRRAGYAKLHALPVRAIDAGQQGDLMARIVADAEAVASGLIQGVPRLLTGVVAIVGTLAAMLSINLWAALTVVLLTPLSYLVARRITLASHTLFMRQADAQGTLTGFVSERVQHHDVMAFFSAEEAGRQAFEERNEGLYRHSFKAQLYGALVNPVTRFVNHMVYVAVGLVGGIMALDGALTIGGISALLSYANGYTRPFNELSSVVHQLQGADAALKRLFALLDAPEEEPDGADALSPASALGETAFRDVSFRYEEDKPLIEGFSLSVSSGQKVAIVGPTGAGKTTLVNLLMRFYDVDGGEIFIDGTPIARMKRSALRGLFAMVLQESWLFSGTVRENIAFGHPGATQEEIEEAARRAHAHGFISRLPGGYDTDVHERSAFSEGQNQLICIARALLANPSMMILDEATSSVDTRTEQYVSRAFDELMRGRTSFVIAHRLSTIRSADLILVLRGGRIVETGTHETLMRRRGFYYELYMSQFDATESTY